MVLLRLARLLLTLSVWLGLYSMVHALDYYEITNPRFTPLQVAVAMQPATSVKGLFVQSVFQSNLEQTLFFTVEESDSEAAAASSPEAPAFRLHLRVSREKPWLAFFVLRESGREKPILEGQLEQRADRSLRDLGRLLADRITKATLGFSGLSFSKIAYTAQARGSRKNIMLTSYDGTQQRRFSYNLGSNNFASWDPTGKQLLYTTLTRSSAQIQLQHVDRYRAQILEFQELDRRTQPLAGSWSPDGHSLLLALMRQGTSDLYQYTFESGTLTPIVTWRSLETSPVWSPDGTRIAFVSDAARNHEPQIYLYDTRTKRSERVTYKGRYNSSPRWSPDGRMLAYEGRRKGVFQIFKYDLLRRRHQQLTFGRYNSQQPDWAPNGRQLVFSSHKTGVTKLYYISTHGGPVARVTTSPPAVVETQPAWTR
jgi:TolB protein